MVGGTLGMRGPLNLITKTPYTAYNNGCLLGISLKFHSSPLKNDGNWKTNHPFFPFWSPANLQEPNVKLPRGNIIATEHQWTPGRRICSNHHEVFRIKKTEVNISYHERNLRVGCVFNATNLENSPIQISP